MPGTKPAPPGFIPSSVELTGHYAIVYDRTAPLFAEPVFADRQVAFENAPMGDAWDRVSLEIELPF